MRQFRSKLVLARTGHNPEVNDQDYFRLRRVRDPYNPKDEFGNPKKTTIPVPGMGTENRPGLQGNPDFLTVPERGDRDEERNQGALASDNATDESSREEQRGDTPEGIRNRVDPDNAATLTFGDEKTIRMFVTDKSPGDSIAGRQIAQQLNLMRQQKSRPVPTRN